MTTIAPLGSSEDEISKIRTTDLNAHTQNTVDADLITQLNQSIQIDTIVSSTIIEITIRWICLLQQSYY
jgi:hypothetical protein